MHEDLQQAVDSGKLSQKAAETLTQLEPGAFCQHKSWGFGKVSEWNISVGQILIDFEGKKHHPMQLEYAAETLQPIPEAHILARRISDPEVVREQAANDPLGLIRSILADHGDQASLQQITDALVPSIFTAAAFKKWWESTKKKMKSDGHFQMPMKKTEPFVLLKDAVDPSIGLLEKFRMARFLKDQVAALDQITKSLDDFGKEEAELQVLVGEIEDAAQKGRVLQAAQALELLLARDEILARHPGLTADADALGAVGILLAEQSRMIDLFAAIPASKQRRALEQFPAAFGDNWVDVALRLAKQSPSRLIVEVARSLERADKTESLRDALTKWISDRSITTEILIWLARERGAAFPELFNADLLNAIFSSLERDMLDEKRGSRLQDLLLTDRTLLGELLATSGLDAVRDAMRRLKLTPVFADLDKRSLMGRIIKLYPEMQSMVSGGESSRDETLTVSWASLDARKNAYEHLINVEIPQNVRDISTARDQGDLRENFGFKAAKEQQRVLMRRRAEAERDLALARGTNFEAPDITQVSIGTVVELTFDDGGHTFYNILGAWDSIPEKHVVSYKAGIGQTLLGRKPGESVELPGDDGIRRATIASITPFVDLDLLGSVPQ